MTNSIREIRDADCILVTGSNTAEAHPVISYEVVRAARRGASLIVIDPRMISLVRHATLHLRPAPGTDHALYLAMLHAILAHGWADEEFIGARTEGFEALAGSLITWTPEAASAICGVPADQIMEAARLYALGLRQDPPPAGVPAPARGSSTILYGMGITERANGTELVKTLANLAMITGQIGRPSTGVNPLRGQCNVQGACDMGALPNVYPGYQQMSDPGVRDKFARAWSDGTTDGGRPQALPEEPGLTYVEMLRAAAQGQIKAMYIMGANPVMANPDSTLVQKALRSLEFLVVQDLFPTETAQLAHVVLPAASFAERSGTFTNTERRLQLLRRVVPPVGEARPDWEIISEIGRRMGRRLQRSLRWTYDSPAAIMREIASLCPILEGISHERLERGGVQWPCPSSDHPGTMFLHDGRFTRGRGRFHPTAPAPPFESTDAAYPLVLSTGRNLYHYNAGPMSRRAGPLEWREPSAYLEVNPRDAVEIGVCDEQFCLVSSRRGTVRVRARIGDVVPPGMVCMPFHYCEAAANVLTHAEALEPGAKTPEYKFIAVRVAPDESPEGAPA